MISTEEKILRMFMENVVSVLRANTNYTPRIESFLGDEWFSEMDSKYGGDSRTLLRDLGDSLLEELGRSMLRLTLPHNSVAQMAAHVRRQTEL